VPVALIPPAESGYFSSQQRQADVVMEGPVFARTRASSRWHRVRSGMRHHALIHEGRELLPDRIAWHLWCSSGSVSSDRGLTLDVLPDDGVPVCGPCEGKATGAGYPSGAIAVQMANGLIFQPRSVKVPRVCPGSGRGGESLWVRLPGGDHRVGTCLVCLTVVPIRSGGGAYQGYTGPASHPPGADLIPRCPLHQWRSLTVVGGVAMCRCDDRNPNRPRW
jgi:hypothetical protein